MSTNEGLTYQNGKHNRIVVTGELTLPLIIIMRPFRFNNSTMSMCSKLKLKRIQTNKSNAHKELR